MSTAAPEILEKIRKLLRLSKSSNANEAALAMARAAEIARKHHIEISQVAADESRPGVSSAEFAKPSRLSEVRKRAMVTVQDYFNVAFLWDEEVMTVVGRAEDIAIGHYVYEFLTQACGRAMSDYNLAGTKERLGFVRGFFIGVRESLEADRKRESANGMEMVLRSKAERESFIEGAFKTKKDHAPRSREAALDPLSVLLGHARGSELSLRRGVAAGGSPVRRGLLEGVAA